jgi:hypothetical protein
MNDFSPDRVLSNKNIPPGADIDADLDLRMVPSLAMAKRQSPDDIGSFPHASFEGLSAVELVALASRAISTDPRSAKAFLDQAVTLLSVPDSELTMDQVAGAKKGTLAMWQMRRVNGYIESNIGRSVRNRDLADAARLSVNYFSRTLD